MGDPQSEGFRRALTWLVAAVMAASSTEAAPGGNAGPHPGPFLPSTPELPRLRKLWTAPWLPPAQWDRAIEPARSGIYLGWKPYSRITFSDREQTLVAFDVRTGREIWRRSGYSYERPVLFAGNLALIRRSPVLSALSLASGKEQWTSSVCAFRKHLHVTTAAGREIGAGICDEIVWIPPRSDPRTSRSIGVHRVEALDLRTGKVLWNCLAHPGSSALGAGPDAIYLVIPAGGGKKPDMRLRVLDPRSGDARRDFPIREEHAFWIHAPPHRPDQVVVIGRELTALDVRTGRLLWRKVRPMWWDRDSPRPPVARDDRLYLSYRDSVYAFDLRTGEQRETLILPGGLGTGHGEPEPRFVPLPEGGLLVVANRHDGPGGLGGPPVTVHYAHPGADPAFSVLPGSGKMVLSIQEGVLVAADHRKSPPDLEGYSVFETVPAEAKALDARGRVRAQLEREPWTPFLRPVDWERRLRDLRAVPGADRIVAEFARDTSLPWQKDALLAATAMEIPGLAGLLRAEAVSPLWLPDTSILRPPPQPRGWGKPDRQSRFRSAMPSPSWAETHAGRIRDSLRALLLFRGFVLSSLAALDDTASAGVLAPILFARHSPTGFGLEDWQRWGKGPKSWPAAKRAPGGFSGCLQGPAGRPEVHADIYRMLSRLGRPSDRVVLERFDSANAPAGWAGLCAADDALPEPYVDPRPLKYGTGMCLGRDLGAYRIAQVGAIWLRRRGRDGLLGPPAWAHDPGGDLLLGVRPLLDARLSRQGALTLTGAPWKATVDPERIFADRDGDGLTDGTETFLGTDPERTDTDGDGDPDGRDPAPRSGPARTEAGRAADEALRYLTLFLAGGPVSVYADGEYWGAGGGAAGAAIVLHWPRQEDRLPGCPAGSFCADGRSAEARNLSPRRCETIMAIESIRVADAGAEATVAWPDGHGRRRAIHLELRKVGGIWRVTEERRSPE